MILRIHLLLSEFISDKIFHLDQRSISKFPMTNLIVYNFDFNYKAMIYLHDCASEVGSTANFGWLAFRTMASKLTTSYACPLANRWGSITAAASPMKAAQTPPGLQIVSIASRACTSFMPSTSRR